MPLLIAGPGVKGGRQVNEFSYVWDLMPTVLDLAEVAHPKQYQGRQVVRMRGKSLNGVLSGTTPTIYSDEDFVGGEIVNGKWMRQGKYKAVSIAPPYGKGDWQLYNVVDDPGETTDLAKAQLEILKILQTAWDNYAKEVGVVLSN